MSGLTNAIGSKTGVIGTTELDYEEGTWTPVFLSGGNTISVTAGSFSGSYVKIGGLCSFNIYANNVTFSGTTANNDTTWSLPFTHTGLRNRTTEMFQSGGSIFTTTVGGNIDANDTKLYLFKQTINYGHAIWSSIGSGTYWYLSGHYRVAK